MGGNRRNKADGKMTVADEDPADADEYLPTKSASDKGKGKLVKPTRGLRSMNPRPKDRKPGSSASSRAKSNRLKDITTSAPKARTRRPAAFSNPAQDQPSVGSIRRPSRASLATQSYRVLSTYQKAAGSDGEGGQLEEDEEDEQEDNDDQGDDDDDEPPSKGRQKTNKPRAIHLNPTLFDTTNYASHARGTIAYLGISPTDVDEARANANNMDFITDGPVLRVRVVCVQIIAHDIGDERQEKEIIRREEIESLENGITVRDIVHLLNQHDEEDDVVEIRTILGSNTYVEIMGVFVQE